MFIWDYHGDEYVSLSIQIRLSSWAYRDFSFAHITYGHAFRDSCEISQLWDSAQKQARNRQVNQHGVLILFRGAKWEQDEPLKVLASS